jgi:alanyl-tRNA synthetase
MFRGGLADHSSNVTKYHTATHLLHAALRQVLGPHVQQKGSNITAERLRFDFTHPAKLTASEIEQVEMLVNQKIQEDLAVSQAVQPYQEALAQGALAFFGEKYPEQVSVYTIGDPHGKWFSKELCGGPHVTHTGEIGSIKLTRETAAAAGVRRLYAQLV